MLEYSEQWLVSNQTLGWGICRRYREAWSHQIVRETLRCLWRSVSPNTWYKSSRCWSGCRRNANVSIACPVEPGTYTVEQTVKLPEEIPRGTSQFYFSWMSYQLSLCSYIQGRSSWLHSRRWGYAMPEPPCWFYALLHGLVVSYANSASYLPLT